MFAESSVRKAFLQGGCFCVVLGVLCFFLKEEEDGDGVVCYYF